MAEFQTRRSEASAAGSECPWHVILSRLCRTEAAVNVRELLLRTRICWHFSLQTLVILSSSPFKFRINTEPQQKASCILTWAIILRCSWKYYSCRSYKQLYFFIALLDNLLSGVSGYRYSKFSLQVFNSMCPIYLNDPVTLCLGGCWAPHGQEQLTWGTPKGISKCRLLLSTWSPTES